MKRKTVILMATLSLFGSILSSVTEPIMASTTESHSVNVEFEINDEYLARMGYSMVASIPQTLNISRDGENYTGTGEIFVKGIIGYDEKVKISLENNGVYEIHDPTGAVSCDAKAAFTTVSDNALIDENIQTFYFNADDTYETLQAVNGVEGYTKVSAPISTKLNVSASSFKYKGSYEGSFIVNINVEKEAGLYDAEGNMLCALTKEQIETTSYTSLSNLPTTLGVDATQVAEVVIPEGTTSIGNCAFYNCKSLTSVTIPNSVTNIGDWAFKGCTNLISVTIPDSVTSIGNGTFFNCTSLTSVTIPNSVTSIGDWAFKECTSLTSVTIPDSVTTIGNRVFDNCTSLESVTIPDGVTSIGNYIFDNCTNLKSVTIPDSVTSIGNGTFMGCTRLESVTIPDSVTNIGMFAFDGCTRLESITIPDSVTSIGTSAFYNVPHIYYNGTATGSPWGAIAIN